VSVNGGVPTTGSDGNFLSSILDEDFRQMSMAASGASVLGKIIQASHGTGRKRRNFFTMIFMPYILNEDWSQELETTLFDFRQLITIIQSRVKLFEPVTS
jgi:hypothetical protein